MSINKASSFLGTGNNMYISLVLILPKAGIEQNSWESYVAVYGIEGMEDKFDFYFAESQME